LLFNSLRNPVVAQICDRLGFSDLFDIVGCCFAFSRRRFASRFALRLGTADIARPCCVLLRLPMQLVPSSSPDAGRRLALRWHSVFFTCPLLDSRRKKTVFVACDKKQKTFFWPLLGDLWPLAV
jgi:hypothetical protein